MNPNYKGLILSSLPPTHPTNIDFNTNYNYCDDYCHTTNNMLFYYLLLHLIRKQDQKAVNELILSLLSSITK